MQLPPLWLAMMLAPALFAGCSSSASTDDDETQQTGDDDSPALIDADGDGFYTPDDCDDNNKDINPGATETCNGLDDNCDGKTDSDDAKGQKTWFKDADSDGYGDPLSRVQACAQPVGFVADNTDCDDSISSAHPGSTEVCGDGVDNDCDKTSNACGLGGQVSLSAAVATLSGFNAKDQFGTSVSPAGDVNGDGTPDFLIGAYQEDGPDAKSPSIGAAYLVYGPVTGVVDMSKVVKFEGEAAGDWAGLVVSAAGDVNGDGFDDVLVGAPYNDREDADGSLLMSTGAAYLLYGPLAGTITLADADVKIEGIKASDSAGYTLAAAGDVNKDGYDDILIGAWSAGSESGPEAGTVYLMYGPITKGEISLSEANVTLVGEEAYYLTGYSIASGDFDGDGYSDILIGAPYAGDSSQGAAYVVYGPIKTPLVNLANAGAKLMGEAAADTAGRAVANAGDVDGDGKDDILVASPNANNGAIADTGAVYLVKGPPAGQVNLADASARFLGVGASDHAGRSIAGAGDVNGDGSADFLIGQLGDTSGRSAAGSVYLIYGPTTGSHVLTDADAQILGLDIDDKMGYAVSTAGDMNGDGFSDILIGVPDRSNSTDFPGAAYLLEGGPGL